MSTPYTIVTKKSNGPSLLAPNAYDAKKAGSSPPRPGTPPTPSPETCRQAMFTTKNEVKFPWQLFQLLEDAEKEGFDHIIAWLREGDGFRILDPSAFAKDIMPRYFTMSHYKSFQRQLSLYSFKRETEGRKRDAYCHPFFRRENRDLCVYVPREKKRQPKNKKSRRNRYGMHRNTLNTNEAPSHSRALSSEEVAEMLNSPSVSPIPEDYINTNTGTTHPLYRSAYAPAPGVVHQNYPAVPVLSNNVQQQPRPQQQATSFFAEADPSPYQLQPAQQQQQGTSFFAEADPSPVQPRLVVQQSKMQLPKQQHALPPGRPLQFPIKSKPAQSKQWMQDHEQSLWNYVNGLVVDSTKSFDDKNDLKREASNFSTDEILAEIASTFNGNGQQQQQRSSSMSNGSSSGNSQNSTMTPAPAFSSPPQDASYCGL